MKKFFFAFIMNLFDLLPAQGVAIAIRGGWASLFLKKTGQNLKLSSHVNIYNPHYVTVGDNVYIGYNTYLGGGEIVLDDEVIIGPFCSIAAGNHTIKNGSYRFGPYDYGKITIGRGTWLGSHCVITSNVNIGKGCLIAAGSVVTKDVEDFSVVGGVPAKLLKKVNPEENHS